MTAIAGYWASVGIKPDEGSLKKVDAFLRKVENKLKGGIGKEGVTITPKVNIGAFEKHLRNVLRNVGAGDGQKALRVRVQVSESHLRKSIESATIDKPVTAKVVAKLDKGSITTIKEQLRVALSDLLINARLGGAGLASRARTASSGRVDNSWSPNARGNTGAGLSVIERLQGNVPKGSNSAAVRRHFDSMMSEAFIHPNAAPTLKQFAGETVIGAVGRKGASTMLGRGLGVAGNMIGGARLGGLGLGVGAALNLGAAATKAIWSGLATTVTAPFKLVGGAVSAVTSGFYRLALTLAPLVGGFMMLNRTVQQSSQRQIALNTVSKSLGSEGRVESAWLMDMANRDGMRYNTLIDPYTTFIASASPAMGLGGAKDVFESFTQFGLTRGANDISMGLAMKAVSQIN